MFIIDQQMFDEEVLKYIYFFKFKKFTETNIEIFVNIFKKY